MKPLTLVGIGRLGLCTALLYERAGFDVLGVDLRADYCAELNAKTFNSPEPHVNDYLAQSQHFRATTDISEGCAHSDWIYILVDTPNGNEEPYDHKNLLAVLRACRGKLAGKRIVICATVLPGFCASILVDITSQGAELCYHPEFIAQGNVIAGLERPDMILIGASNALVGAQLAEHARAVVLSAPPVHCMDLLSAEITKLALNCYVTMKISYANMIGDLAAETGANADLILAAVGDDARVGQKYLRAGYGFGGPCFPRDNRALAYFAARTCVPPLLPLATDAYNAKHAELMAQRMLTEDKAEYVFEQVAYKADCAVPIIEESQKLAVASLIAAAGKRVLIRDRAEIISLVQDQYASRFLYEEIA